MKAASDANRHRHSYWSAVTTHRLAAEWVGLPKSDRNGFMSCVSAFVARPKTAFILQSEPELY
jgi:hypothetical protein